VKKFEFLGPGPVPRFFLKAGKFLGLGNSWGPGPHNNNSNWPMDTRRKWPRKWPVGRECLSNQSGGRRQQIANFNKYFAYAYNYRNRSKYFYDFYFSLNF
jgi:hypothetical protein